MGVCFCVCFVLFVCVSLATVSVFPLQNMCFCVVVRVLCLFLCFVMFNCCWFGSAVVLCMPLFELCFVYEVCKCVCVCVCVA